MWRERGSAPHQRQRAGALLAYDLAVTETLLTSAGATVSHEPTDKKTGASLEWLAIFAPP